MIITRGYGVDHGDAATHGCPADVSALIGCAEDAGVPMAGTGVLINQYVTLANIREDFRRATDLFDGLPTGHLNLVFSSHGVQRPDRSADEPDGLDEGIVMADKNVLWDDELAVRIAELPRHVTVAMIVDACHSGTAFRGQAGKGWLSRMFGGRRTFVPFRNPLVCLSACRDAEYAGGLPDGGVWTKALALAWNRGYGRSTWDMWFSNTAPFVRVQHPKITWINETPAFMSSKPWLGVQ